MKPLHFLLTSLAVLFCSPSTAQDCLKLMSYNIRLSAKDDGQNSWRYRRQATARLLQTERPALIGMQEVCPDQLTYLDSVMTQYGHVGVGREDGKSEGEMMAVFYDRSLLDLQQWGSFWLSETPDVPSLGWDAAYKRTCTWTLLKYRSTGQPILFFNTHLDNVGVEARKHEVQMIADSIRSIAVRHHLAGDAMVFLSADFNTSAGNPIFQPLKEILNEARSITQDSDKGYTFNGFGKVDPEQAQQTLDESGNSDNEIVVDHIFSRGVRPLSFRVCRGDYGVPYISDHFPIVFECQLARKKEVRRILAIGNSFSEDAVEQYLWEIAENQGMEVVLGNLYYPGCTLERHANNVRLDSADYSYRKVMDGIRLVKDHTTIREALADEDWQVVTLQQASHLSGEFDSYEPFLTEIIDSIGSIHQSLSLSSFDSSPTPPLPLAWHKTWAYSKDSKHGGFVRYGKSQKKMYKAIGQAAARLTDYPFYTTIPSGDAIQAARKTPLGDSLCRDGFHLNLDYGRYCCALTWAEALLGIDATRVTWKPETVSEEQASYARQSAHKACNNDSH